MAAFNSLNEMKIGMRVRCVYTISPHYNKTAVIDNIVAASHYNPIIVKWDDGSIDDLNWSSFRSFEPIDDQEEVKTQAVAVPIASAVAINDHTCPTCKNTKCSKIEKTCWSCGGKL